MKWQKELRPARILLVDDNPGDVMLAREGLALARVVCELLVAEHGLEAQELLEAGAPPQLILLDLNMPVMDGREFLDWIKSEPKFMAIPVVVLTTSDSDLDVQEAWTKQCSAYIRKPVTLTGLADAFKRLDDFYFAIVELPRADP